MPYITVFIWGIVSLQSGYLCPTAFWCSRHSAWRKREAKSLGLKLSQDWCSENGFKPENASNFRKKLEQKFVYQKRRSWNEDTGSSTMVNNVTWASGEELEEGLVPEFEEIQEEAEEIAVTDGKTDGKGE